jgi:hypothetical protein
VADQTEAARPEKVSQQTGLISVEVGDRGLVFRTLAEIQAFATYLVRAGLAPKGLDKPEAVVIAICYGRELGLNALQSLQGVRVIHGRAAPFGDTLLGVCMARPDWLHGVFAEWTTGKPFTDEWTAHCRVGRAGRQQHVVATFSWADAKKADLISKPGPWQQWPARMLKLKARSLALRDTFPDVLCGLHAVSSEHLEGQRPASEQARGQDTPPDIPF